MSTDLHLALREAVADDPPDEFDLRAVLDAGSRRVRRRAALTVGASALVAAAVVITSVAVGQDRQDHDPLPADVVHLDLGQAEEQDLDVLASVRTTHSDPANDLGHDRFEGLTTDGLVLRNRYTRDVGRHELGLLDPVSGRTDWLPPPPDSFASVVEATADRLVLFGGDDGLGSTMLVFDRHRETWESSDVRLPAGIEVHVPYRPAIGPDGRFYLGSNLEGESGPLHWWSYAVPQGGDGRPEVALDGEAVAWGDGVRATADPDGRVVLSTSGEERLVAQERPEGCERPSDPGLAEMPVLLGLAGDRPVVTYWCGDTPEPLTVVYDVDGGSTVQVEGAVFVVADEGHVVLAPSFAARERGVFLLELDGLTITRIAPAMQDDQLDLAGGLILWNSPGPLDSKQSYDVVWQVARVPR